MKKIFYYFILTSIFVLTTAVSCNKPEQKPEEQLPAGENTIYYYIDGELYIPEDSVNGGQFSPAINHLSCYGDNLTFELFTDEILLHFQDGIQNLGVIVLNQSNYDSCQVFENHAFYHGIELWEDGIYHTTLYYTHDGSGEVNITYLSENKRHFKGIFEMTVYHENTGVEKHITDGHFNINLETLED